MSKSCLIIDQGFGHCKILYSIGGKIINKIKFPSAVAITSSNELINDDRVIKYDGKDYYVGKDALKMQSSAIVDVDDYQKLEYTAPLFLYYACKLLGGVSPDIIVTGLSKAHIQYSGYYEKALKEFEINGVKFTNNKIIVLPQGAGSKLAIDAYGDSFPEKNRDFMGETSYVGVDIGFNTIDVFQVINGKTSPNLFEGIEQHGVMKIAKEVVKYIHETLNKDITLNDAKDIIDTKSFSIRNNTYDLSEVIGELKKQYLNELLVIIENRYGKILDKMSFVHLSGGGSYMFIDTKDPFFKIPKNDNEYYNVIGYHQYIVNKLKVEDGQ